MNLLAETLNLMKLVREDPNDIVFIGSAGTGHECEWGEFYRMADVEYDPYRKEPMVATDLIIVFKSGARFTRIHEDGKYTWAYIAQFVTPVETKEIQRLVIGYGEEGGTLEEINDGFGF